MFNGWPWDKLYQREYVRRLGIKYQNLRTTNDMLFVFIALACASRISTVDEVLIHQNISVAYKREIMGLFLYCAFGYAKGAKRQRFIRCLRKGIC